MRIETPSWDDNDLAFLTLDAAALAQRRARTRNMPAQRLSSLARLQEEMLLVFRSSSYGCNMISKEIERGRFRELCCEAEPGNGAGVVSLHLLSAYPLLATTRYVDHQGRNT